jgi:excisionase family DNA binding protein
VVFVNTIFDYSNHELSVASLPVTDRADLGGHVEMQKLGLSILEAAEASGVGRTTLYEEIRHSRLKAKKIGRRTVILRDDLEDWLKNCVNCKKRSHD